MGNADLAVAVFADDLSGGADCGVAFARAGLDTVIQLDRHAELPPGARVAVLPTDSRDELPGNAVAAVTEALTVLAGHHPALWYKKIDSTLRGHAALELSAAVRAVKPQITVVAPAFPAHGRAMTHGHGFQGGVPLERSEVWRGSGTTGTSYLPARLRGPAGLRVWELRVDDVRAGNVAKLLTDAAGAVDVVVCDSETEDDLSAIASAGLASGLNILWVGSAGLARHLAPLIGGGEASHGSLGADGGLVAGDVKERRPVAIVVGSATGTAAAQLVHLESRPSTRVIRVHPGDVTAADGEIGQALAQGQDVAVGIVPPDSPDVPASDAETSRALSHALGELISRHDDSIGGFVLTGGNTATAVLRACGVTTLRPLREVATGVPVSSCPDGRLVVTKAGAFGDDEVLAKAADLLRGAGNRSTEGDSTRASL